MSSSYGKNITLTLFGESHGQAVGATLDGLPAGTVIDKTALTAFMERRAGGRSRLTTPRAEADAPQFLSGVLPLEEDENRLVSGGTPLTVLIDNENKRSGDYARHRDLPRPSHADYTALARYGETVDLRGGGHFSARQTAPLCAAGFFCLSYLASRGVTIGTHLAQVGGLQDARFDGVKLTKDALTAPAQKAFPVINDEAGHAMQAEILAASEAGDSVGGVVECAVLGMPAGYGDPVFDGVENRLSAALFALGGVRGIEFGTGFESASMRGSRHNDPFCMQSAHILTKTNHHGGVLGGITSGMPLIFRLAFKPTASIALCQETVSLSQAQRAEICIKGRHDPCIALRALPCVEALTALVLADLLVSRVAPHHEFSV